MEPKSYQNRFKPASEVHSDFQQFRSDLDIFSIEFRNRMGKSKSVPRRVQERPEDAGVIFPPGWRRLAILLGRIRA